MPPQYLTISAATIACRQSFERCITVPYLMEDEWAENRLADFNLWSEGSGASAGGRASLDSRLELEPDTKGVMINLLRMLIALLERCLRAAHNMERQCPHELQHSVSVTPRESDEASLVMYAAAPSVVPDVRMEDPNAGERRTVRQYTADVEEILKEMIRLTVAIRKSGSSSRFRKADDQFDRAAHHELSAHLQVVLKAHLSWDRTQPTQMDTLELNDVQRRLIEANLRRRNRFLYQQKHSRKLAKVEKLPTSDHKENSGIWQNVKKSISFLFKLCHVRRNSRKLTSSTSPRGPRAPRKQPTAPSKTSASSMKGGPIEIPKGTTTVVSTVAAKADYPAPPKLKPGRKFFKCPCCCQSLAIENAQRKRWRKHLAEDIQPYTCILENCPRPWEFFDHQEEWIKHMKTEHESHQYWRCPTTHCSDQRTFDNKEDFISHLQNDPSEPISMEDIQLFTSVCAQSDPMEVKSCPLCPHNTIRSNEDAGALWNHISEHVHSFSLRSLPWGPTGKKSSWIQRILNGDEDYFHRNPYFNIDDNDRSSAPNVDSFSDRSSGDPELLLQKYLMGALVEQRPGSEVFYLPEDRKSELITPAIIEAHCQLGAPEATTSRAKEVFDSCRNLFTILALIKKAPDLCTFLDEGLSDADLPFSYQSDTNTLMRRDGGSILSARPWPKLDRLSFTAWQWKILTPIFSGQSHYEFSDDVILPFLDERPISRGAYSDLYEAKIHPAHHKWHQEPGLSKPLLVAIKKFHCDNEDDFEKERAILVALEAKGNNHLVKLLFSYVHKSNYHLVFLRATGNLRNFWEQTPQPQFAQDMVLWSLGQMIGITRGLQTIHNFKVSIPPSLAEMETETPQGKAKMSVSSGEERYGRHGDLKPENILWFQDPTDDVCQITDFGLGRFHGRDTKTKAPPYTIFSSPTYEPPECHIYLPVSRAYDLWSLGCLYLEWVSWMLKGWSAIDEFSRSRVEKSFIMSKEGLISDDYFWSLILQGTTNNARVRDGVEKWVRSLREDPKCSQLIHDLLNLIMNELLCITPKERSDAAQLNRNLRELLVHAEKDSDYALKPCPWVPKASATHQRLNITVMKIADEGSSGS